MLDALGEKDCLDFQLEFRMDSKNEKRLKIAEFDEFSIFYNVMSELIVTERHFVEKTRNCYLFKMLLVELMINLVYTPRRHTYFSGSKVRIRTLHYRIAQKLLGILMAV